MTCDELGGSVPGLLKVSVVCQDGKTRNRWCIPRLRRAAGCIGSTCDRHRMGWGAGKRDDWGLCDPRVCVAIFSGVMKIIGN